MGVTCKSCKYFIADDDSLIGECRLYPKVYQVQPGHWCGQYKRRPKDAKKDKEEVVDTKLFVSTYAQEFKDKYNVKYSPDWVRDTQAAKILIREEGFDGGLEYCRSFINNPPKWYKENNQINLRCVPKARNQIALKKAKVKPKASDFNGEIEQFGTEHDWPDYVDYRRKGGDKGYQEWSEQ